MKKILIITMALALLLCTACNSNKSDDIHYYLIHDFYGEMDPEQNPFWEHDVERVSKYILKGNVKTVEFDGSEYQGTYAYTNYLFYNNYRSDYYEFENGEFSVNEDTGKVDSIFFYNRGEGNKTAEDCKDKAAELASKFININDYELSIEENESGSVFYFERAIGGYKAASMVTVLFSNSGELISLIARSTEGMNELLASESYGSLEERVQLLSSDDAQNGLEKKIDQVVPDCDEYNILDTTIVFLRDGNIGLLYKIETLEKNDLENGNTDITGKGLFILAA